LPILISVLDTPGPYLFSAVAAGAASEVAAAHFSRVQRDEHSRDIREKHRLQGAQVSLSRRDEIEIVVRIKLARFIDDMRFPLNVGDQSRSRKSAQGDKWSFCLTAGTLWPANQERP
jgi:hypothetical protein